MCAGSLRALHSTLRAVPIDFNFSQRTSGNARHGCPQADVSLTCTPMLAAIGPGAVRRDRSIWNATFYYTLRKQPQRRSAGVLQQCESTSRRRSEAEGEQTCRKKKNTGTQPVRQTSVFARSRVPGLAALAAVAALPRRLKSSKPPLLQSEAHAPKQLGSCSAPLAWRVRRPCQKAMAATSPRRALCSRVTSKIEPARPESPAWLAATHCALRQPLASSQKLCSHVGLGGRCWSSQWTFSAPRPPAKRSSTHC